jgi:ribonucleoside-diphosphate reductase alpha chain
MDRKTVYESALKYFNGDALAADVWVNKYCLKSVNKDNIKEIIYHELTPDDMHLRIANELYRIESKYINPIDKNQIFDLIKNFKYIIPQGSPMSGIGNDFQVVSLSNCFVIGNEFDSYGSIIMTDEEQIQLMKRRGGVGHDLSHIRPKGTIVQNSAMTSTGIVPFMERYSNSTKEVAQDGRRGALMLTCSIKHPDSESFIDAKMESGKITGANISVKIDDDFMNSIVNKTQYEQKFPIDSIDPKISKFIDSDKLWKKIVHNAWQYAEPGVLFWDTVIRESVPDCYISDGFKTISTNPCGEITLCPNDSCRLLAINLYSYVVNPFTKDAYFDFDLFKKHINYSQRFMDDIVDLEIEKIEKILEKIKSDNEPEHIKNVETNIWNKIMAMTKKGRRTGLGITAEGDMLAALNMTYGTSEATDFATTIHKMLAIEAYKTSCILARERGSFPIYDYNKELNNPFINRLKNDEPELIELLKDGRRNIALLTVAPTGSVSIMSQTTSGIEPVYLVSYKRRRKINPSDKNIVVDYTDDEGIRWQEYNVFHHKFETWLSINNYNIDDVKMMKDDELKEIIKLSPYYNATSNDVNWVEKVRMQGSIQKYVDHSISVTVNLPENITEDVVEKVYKTAWESGCKGVTVYRDKSRQGVIVSNETKPNNTQINNIPKRPKILDCDVMQFICKGEKWIGFIGLEPKREKSPYEIFTGPSEYFLVPNYVEKGQIRKDKIKDQDGNLITRYDFIYHDKDGFEVTMQGLNRAFNREFWNVGKLVSGLLRHHIHFPSVVKIIDSLKLDGDTMGTWKKGVIRILKHYNPEEEKTNDETCPDCGGKNIIHKEGCISCMDCPWSRCT